MSKTKDLVISVANLPKKFLFSKDPLEREMEAQEILAEMGVCPHCKEVGPCGCPNPNCPEDVDDPRFKDSDLERGIDTT
jgi:hypothetical protein